MLDSRHIKAARHLGGLAMALGLLLGAPAQGQAAGKQGAALSCDEACLTRILDQYLAALVSHDVKRAPLAKTVRFSENDVMLKVGDGVWGTVSGIDHSKELKFTDPAGGSAGYFGVIEEHGNPGYFALRIKVRGRKITEIESIVRRPESGPGLNPKEFQPDPLYAEVVPPARRVSRKRMAELAFGYFKTLQLNDGKIFTEFSDDCLRRENGQVTAGPPSPDRPKVKGCLEQLKLGEVRRITSVRQRVPVVIDEAHGLVMSRAFLDHDGILTEYPRTDGTIMSAAPHTVPQTWCLLELFKIIDGKLTRIQAVMIGVPYKLPSPWAKDPAF